VAVGEIGAAVAIEIEDDPAIKGAVEEVGRVRVRGDPRIV
jgi:hypothetical protein